MNKALETEPEIYRLFTKNMWPGHALQVEGEKIVRTLHKMLVIDPTGRVAAVQGGQRTLGPLPTVLAAEEGF